MKRLILIFSLCLMSGSIFGAAATRTVYVDAEPREGFILPGGTKVVVTADSLVHVFSYRDVGAVWVEWSYANGVNTAFTSVDSVMYSAYLNGFTAYGFEDSVYVLGNHTTVGPHEVRKLYGGAKVVLDTMGTDTASYDMSWLATDGTNWIMIAKTSRHQTGAYSWIVWQLPSAEIGGATDWVLVDTIGGNSAATQHRGMAAPIMGGLLHFNQTQNTWNLVENRASGGITKRISLPFKKKNASTAINNGAPFYDMSITPIDPAGAGDTALIATVDSLTNAVWVYMIRADTAANTLAFIDSAMVSDTGDVSDILDSAAWRTPTITMMGDGFAVYYRDWADTTDLATTRIAYHTATDWTDLSTLGTVQYLATDSAGAGGTIGSIMAPWSAVASPNAGKTYACVAWNRWDAAMNIYLTYEEITTPATAAAANTSRLILGAVYLKGVHLARP